MIKLFKNLVKKKEHLHFQLKRLPEQPSEAGGLAFETPHIPPTARHWPRRSCRPAGSFSIHSVTGNERKVARKHLHSLEVVTDMGGGVSSRGRTAFPLRTTGVGFLALPRHGAELRAKEPVTRSLPRPLVLRAPFTPSPGVSGGPALCQTLFQVTRM